MDNRELYNHLAEKYNLRQQNPATNLLRKKEMDVIDKFVKGIVLDLGCGTGYHLDFLKNGIGLDISEKVLRIAKARNKPIIQANIEQLAIKSGSVDTVCCFYGTLNFVDLEKSIKEVSRVLKDKGVVILSVVSTKDIDKHRSSQVNKIKKFRLEGKPVNMKLFEKQELEEVFRKNNLKLGYFNSLFRTQKPRWGNFQKFSFWEQLELKIEKIFPKVWGRIYIFVFEKA